MSSVQSHIKQQNIVYGALAVSNSVTLNTFTRNPFYASDPNSTSGHFTVATVTTANDASGLTPIFRDMGEVIVSANRTFRRVQALSNLPATFGVGGAPSSNAVVSDYRTYWYEVSLLDGQGAINALFQVRG